MRFSRLAVVAIGAVVTLGAIVFSDAPDEIPIWALWDEPVPFTAESFTRFDIAPGLGLISSVSDIPVATGPAPAVDSDVPRSPPLA